MSTSSPTTRPAGAWPWVACLSRWILGGIFLSMGFSKAMHPVDFLKIVRQFDVFQNPTVLNLIAAWLPWFEVVCGVFLVAGVAVRGAGLVSIAMLIPFTGLVLRRALAIHAAHGEAFCSIRFDCGCGSGEVNICAKLFQNSLLILLAVLVTALPHSLFCLRRKGQSGTGLEGRPAAGEADGASKGLP